MHEAWRTVTLDDQDRADVAAGQCFAVYARHVAAGDWRSEVRRALRIYDREQRRARASASRQNRALNAWMIGQL